MRYGRWPLPVDGHPDPEHLEDHLGVENVVGLSPRRQPAVVEQDQLLAVLRGHVEVVEHHDDGPARRVEAAEQLHDLQLVVEVEVVERLVEQQDRRLLGQGLGDEGPLALAARELR